MKQNFWATSVRIKLGGTVNFCKIGTIIASILLGVMTSIVGLAPPAAVANDDNSIRGCHGKYRHQADPWEEWIWYSYIYAFTVPKPVVRDDFMLATEETGYIYCPNGKYPDKIKVIWEEFCWDSIDQRRFREMRARSYIYDDSGKNLNLKVTVERDPALHKKCRTVHVLNPFWQWMKDEPRRKAHITLDIGLWPDAEAWMKTASGGTVNYILPDHPSWVDEWQNDGWYNARR